VEGKGGAYDVSAGDGDTPWAQVVDGSGIKGVSSVNSGSV